MALPELLQEENVRRRNERRRRTVVALTIAIPCGLLVPQSLRAAPAPATSVPKLPAVHLDGTYFTREGKRFIPLGAHWVPAKAAMQWPTQWDPEDIEADFAKMHELGYSLVRFDMLWAWFEPRPGDYNPAAFQQLDFLISLANKYQIYLHPSLFIGGEVGEAYWDVPWRHGRNPHRDPDMVRLETNHATELGRRYANETAIIAWDLTDEPPFWIVSGQTTDARAINWTRLIAGGLRRHDKLHPIVVGTSGQETGHGPFRADNIAEEVDFLSVHPFTLYKQDLFPDPLLSERGTYGAAFEITLSQPVLRPGGGKHRSRSLVLYRCLARAEEEGALPAHAPGDPVGHDDLGPPGSSAGQGVQEVLPGGRPAGSHGPPARPGRRRDRHPGGVGETPWRLLPSGIDRTRGDPLRLDRGWRRGSWHGSGRRGQ